MPANKYALLRYRIIDGLISNQYDPFPSKEDLREACEDELYGSGSGRISISTIEKDIFAMRFEKNLGYHAPIAYSKLEKGYYYEDEGYTIEHISLNDSDVESIRYAAAVLKQYKSLNVFDKFEATIDKVLDRVNVSLDDNRTNIEEFVRFDTPVLESGSRWFPGLVNAILERYKIQLHYKKFDAEESKLYELNPYWLKEYQDTWYLIAYSVERGKLMTFGLDRVERLTVLEESYPVDANIDLPAYFHNAIGITTGENQQPISIVLEVTYPEANYILNKPWHSSQEVLSDDGKKATVGLTVLQTPELISKILSFGKGVVVREPEALRNEINAHVESLSSRYKKT